MKMNHSQEFLKKRKFYLALPLLVLPFITMIFWAMGGGQGSAVNAMATEQAGLNLSLPDAHFNEKEIWDKLTLYEIAERDSTKYEEARESDPYFDLMAFKTEQEPPNDELKSQSKLIDSFPKKDKRFIDPNEEKVKEKLEALYKEMNKPQLKPMASTENYPDLHPPGDFSYDEQFTSDVDRLEEMMERFSDQAEPDPEMKQIGNVLDKILDIQHPERVKEKFREQDVKNRERVFKVEPVNSEHISVLASSNEQSRTDSLQSSYENYQSANAFYGLDEPGSIDRIAGNAMQAVIHDTQELVTGATVKMRLLDPVSIKDVKIGKDQFVYGTCAINGERLTVEIKSIRWNNSLLPVSLSVYDLDGLEGIYIPGAISREAAKQASDEALQNIQLMSLDPSIGAQAASAGVEAAKGLFSKKAKLIKVTVKAGYHILLQDKNSITQ